MRILHSSDWHLGQHFFGRSREAEHRQLIRWVLDEVEDKAVDLLLIAGDLFDTGTPPSYARTLFNTLVLGLRERHCRLLVLGGNHDSVATLSEGVHLLRTLDAEVRPVAAEGVQSLYRARNRSGAVEALIIACPYLRARDLLQRQAGESAEDKQHALTEALRDHFAACYAAALEEARRVDPPLPIILTAHLTVVGGVLSESVRDIYIGTLDAFPAALLPPADYTALGHLHRPQQINSAQPVCYSGSPLPLSFDESHGRKSMQLLEVEPGAPIRCSTLDVPCFQPIAVLEGNLADLEQAFAQLAASRAPAAGQTIWVQVSVAEDDYLNDLVARLEAMSEGLPVEILRTCRVRSHRQQGIEAETVRETLGELEPLEVFQRRLAQETLDDGRKSLLTQAFNEIVSTLHEVDTEDQA